MDIRMKIFTAIGIVYIILGVIWTLRHIWQDSDKYAAKWLRRFVKNLMYATFAFAYSFIMVIWVA